MDLIQSIWQVMKKMNKKRTNLHLYLTEQVNLNSDVEIEDNDITCFDEILKELLTEENNIDQNQKEENNENDNEVKFRIV